MANDLKAALERILEEPGNTLSDGKALKAIVRIAKDALAREANASLSTSKQAGAEPVRECGNGECGWKGKTDRMLGSIGPLCPECGETTELAVMPAAPSDAAPSMANVSWDWLRGVINGIPSPHPPIGFMREVPLQMVLSWIDEAERRAALSQTMQPQAGAVANTALGQPFNRLDHEALTAIPFDSDWSDTRERRAYGKRVAESAAQSCDIQLQQRLATLAAPGAAIAAREQEAEIQTDGLGLDWVHSVLRWAAGGYVHTPERAQFLRGAYRVVDRLVNEATRASRDEAPATPQAAPVTDAQIAQWAERHDIHGSVGELRAMVGDARTLENADVATPQAAIPAAPSKVTDKQIIEWAIEEQFLFFCDEEDVIQIVRSAFQKWPTVAALTQPTTVQQAPQSDAVKVLRDILAESCDPDGESYVSDELYRRGFAALKTAQTTALPGGNGEGES